MSTIFERVKQDLQRGDQGLARTRLLSHLNSKGYDAEILARLGRISFEMHDLYHAGRYWLFSTAEGSDVQTAIEEFTRRCGKNSRHIFSQMMKSTRLPALSCYPEIVQKRLSQLGIDNDFLGHYRRQKSPPRMTKLNDRIVLVIVAILIAFTIWGAIAGFSVIIGWIFPSHS